MLGTKGLQNLCKINKSLFKFKFKLDFSNVNMFKNKVMFYANIYVISFSLLAWPRKIVNFVKIIETYCINLNHNVKTLVLTDSCFHNLTDLEDLGKIIKQIKWKLNFEKLHIQCVISFQIVL